MIPNKLRLPILFSAILLLFAAAGLLLFQPATPASASNAIALQAPPFQDTVSPQDAAALTAIADEAGISAYFNAGSQINLASVRARFRTIEAETSNYIIGSVDVEDYPEEFDVHVYVHRDGWFMAYYLAADPAAKILDLEAYTGGATVSTIFEEVLTIFASEAGVTYPGVTFWDFRYPNANRLMVIAEDFPDGNTFTVRLPSTYVFFERSWAAEGGSQHWVLNDTEIFNRWEFQPMAAGTLTAAQLLPDTTHTIRVGRTYDDHTGALVLVYRVP